MDPGLAKLARLPFFDDGLEPLLTQLGYGSVEMFLAYGPSSEEAFLTKFLNTALVMMPDDQPTSAAEIAALRIRIVARSQELCLFWSLIWATKDTLLAREARLQMFGLTVRPHLRTPGSAVASKVQKLTAGSSPAVAALRGSGDIISPLMNKEILEKTKWIRRLEAIAKKAGDHSKFFLTDCSDEALTPPEQDKLRKAVLAKGAFRTLSTHVRHFERFMGWADERSLMFFPLSTGVLCKYALWLHEKGCGPTVIPSIRAAVQWTAGRLGLVLPDLRDARLIAVEAEAIELRAQELREAVPIPLLAVMLLELFVLRHCSGPDQALAFFAGWILCLIYASLRFDDGVHVNPDSLVFKGGVLLGVCWQTKVERKRRGSRFAVPEVGLSYREGSVSWLQAFWDLSARLASANRDFWMFEVDIDPVTNKFFLSNKVVTFTRAVRILRLCLNRSLSEGAGLQVTIQPAEREEVTKVIPKINMHSCKVTMIDAAVHHGEDPLPISMQAHHANTDLVIKYARNRGDVPLKMLSRLVNDLRGQWQPAPAKALPSSSAAPVEIEDAFSDDGLIEDQPLFYVKKEKLTATALFNVRFHVTSATKVGQLACNKIALAKCEPIGPDLPDRALLCKKCEIARPDLFQ